MKVTSERLERWALDLIGAVEYDIEKECRNNLQDEGEDSIVDEVMSYLESIIYVIENGVEDEE